jgi:hypothetical protein
MSKKKNIHEYRISMYVLNYFDSVPTTEAMTMILPLLDCPFVIALSDLIRLISHSARFMCIFLQPTRKFVETLWVDISLLHLNKSDNNRPKTS